MTKKAAAKEPTFPITDEKAGLRIDRSFVEPFTYTVYYWCERPDADERAEEDRSHWHPDSTHDTLEDAQARSDAISGGAKLKSILRNPGEPAPTGPTKH